MRLRHRRGHAKESQHTHRWLVSYADYMTIMFAFFVVMYAIAINNKDEQFAVFSQTLEQIFDKATNIKADDGNNVSTDGLLPMPIPPTDDVLHGESVQPESPQSSKILPEYTDMSLVSQQQMGEPLDSLLDKFTGALLNEIRQGDAQIELNEDWLTIEMSSGMLFPSGSATVTNQAQGVIARVADVIRPMRNYLRIRGYTDNLPIRNELFSSNWQLSAARAAEVVKQLQIHDITPARMALEGYGQYTPFGDNETEQGRAQNRKVVIAVSKYALPEPEQSQEQVSQEPEQAKQPELEIPSEDNTIKIIQLPHGGIRITTRSEGNEQ
ncbi:OmpA family protein [Pseudoalteromonas sp. SSDWG2]|uniref:OmpA family protein n=1 Tax=Pseudoalteromonas sp. SSDWG2 TaxID=3139391 RepID=UPI003BA9C1B4